MAASGFVLVFMAVLLLGYISGLYVVQGYAIGDLIIAEKRNDPLSCSGTINEIAEPRDREPPYLTDHEYFVKNFKYDRDCFNCSGTCYNWEELKNNEAAQNACKPHKPILYQHRRVCQMLADFLNNKALNTKARCDGGDYLCFNEKYHGKNLDWKPICVCREGESSGCIKDVTIEKGNCSIKVDDDEEKECECKVIAKLQNNNVEKSQH